MSNPHQNTFSGTFACRLRLRGLVNSDGADRTHRLGGRPPMLTMRLPTFQHLGLERRTTFRYPGDPGARENLTVMLEGGLPVGEVRDISTGGIGLSLLYPLEPGTLLNIELYSRALASCCTQRVRVKHLT